MPTPRLSIVLPVLNEARYLGQVLDALRSQESVPQGVEILVVDGGSTDGTPKVVEERALHWNAIRLLRNSKKRSSPARNLGAAHARGEYILYLDGHCILGRPDFLKRVVALFEETGADCLCRPQPLEQSPDSAWGRAISLARHSPLGHNPGSDIYSETPGFTRPETAGAAYRRTVILELGGYDERFDACEDVEFNHRVALAGYRSYKHPDLAVSYVPRDSLGRLLYQMIRYGRGRARLMARHTGMTSGILLGGTSGLVALLALAWLFPWPTWLGVVAVLAFLYAGTCLAFAWRKGRSWAEIGRIALVFPVIHGGLLLGFLRGIPEMAYFRLPPQASDVLPKGNRNVQAAG